MAVLAFAYPDRTGFEPCLPHSFFLTNVSPARYPKAIRALGNLVLELPYVLEVRDF